MRRAARFVAVLAAAVLLGGCAFSLQSLPKVGGAGGGTYALKAVFADVLNLPDDAQVRVGAQVVGEVSAITAQDFAAVLTLALDDGVKVPVGTTAQVRFDNPLGDEYVLLQEPVTDASAPAADLAPGATIPEADTSTAPSVEDTFGALSLVLNGGGLNQLQVVIHELNATFAGNQPQIRSFLATIDRAVSTVAGGRAPVDAALASIDRLTHELSAGRQTIGNALAALAPAVGVLAGENSQISSLLQELSTLGAVGAGVARQSGQDSVTDVHDLLPLVQQLESVSQQIGPDLQDLARFEADTPKVAPGAYLQVSAIADVMLPAGAYEPAAVSAATSGPQSGTAAVTALLEGGLS